MARQKLDQASYACGVEDTTPRKGAILGGRYRVERVLGQGGMGIVLAAYQTDLARPVALKLLHPSALSSAEARARFLREARAAAALESDHAVRVLDTGVLEDGSPYMAMEHLEGEDLEKLLAASGAFPIATAVACVLEAAHAIGEAHARGIVHRDIKPSNLFVARRFDGSERVVVLDFGISKGTSTASGNLGLTGSADSMGSPMYMSPERVRGDESVDTRSDIWALGAVLYELVTGKPPFEAKSLTTLAAMILEVEPRPPRELRPDLELALEAVVLRCLRKRPEERLASVAELVRALSPMAPRSEALQVLRAARAAGGSEDAPNSRAETMPAFSETTAPVKVVAARRQKRAVAVLAAFAAIAVAGLVLGARALWWRPSTPPPPAAGAALCVPNASRTFRSKLVGGRISLTAAPDRALMTRWGFDSTNGPSALMVGLPSNLGDQELAPVDSFGVPAVKSMLLSSGTVHDDVVLLTALLTSNQRFPEIDTSRFQARALDSTGAPTRMLGMRAFSMHASIDIAPTGSSSFLGVASTGRRLDSDGRVAAHEVRVWSLFGPPLERLVHELPGVHPVEIEPKWVFGATGITRGFVAFKSERELHALPITPGSEQPAQLLYDGPARSPGLVARRDGALIAWLPTPASGPRSAVAYRALVEGASAFDAERRIAFAGDVSSLVLASDGDRLFVAWTETVAGRRSSRYGLSDGSLEDAFRTSALLELTGEVFHATMNAKGVWLAHGGANLGVIALDCPRGSVTPAASASSARSR